MPKPQSKSRKGSGSGQEPKRNDMIKPITAQISASKVKKSWPTISEVGHASMVQLLRDVSLPVLHAIRGEKRRAEFQQLLNQIMNKTSKKLSKISVPSTTRDTHFKYDKLVSQRDNLEAALLPLLEQIPLLEAEIDNEESKLEEDEAYLETLKANARDQKTKFASQSASIEALLSRQEKVDDPEDINYKPPSSCDNNNNNNSRNALLTNHINKIAENTGELQKLLDSCEILSSKLQNT